VKLHPFADIFIDRERERERERGGYLLKSRHWIKQSDVQHGVVLRERAVPIVVDQLDDRVEVVRIRKAVLSISMGDLDELIGSALAQRQSILAALGRRVAY